MASPYRQVADVTLAHDPLAQLGAIVGQTPEAAGREPLQHAVPDL
jgi:hypothetical protein